MVLRFLPYIGAMDRRRAARRAPRSPFSNHGRSRCSRSACSSPSSWSSPISSSRGSTARRRKISPPRGRRLGAFLDLALGWAWAWCWRLRSPSVSPVAGKYLPDLAFLDLLMGDKPSIAPGDRLYQRLLALNEEEAGGIVEQHVPRSPRRSPRLTRRCCRCCGASRGDFSCRAVADGSGHAPRSATILRQIIADQTRPSPRATDDPRGRHRFSASRARDEVDELAALMLAQVLAESGIAATVLSSKLFAGESVGAGRGARTVHRLHLLGAAGFPRSPARAAPAKTAARARLPRGADHHRALGSRTTPNSPCAAARGSAKAGADETYPRSAPAQSWASANLAACTPPPAADRAEPRPPR